MNEEKKSTEDYFKSFETSYDLSDCFNGSTKPETPSLLAKRLNERKVSPSQAEYESSPQTATSQSLPNPQGEPVELENVDVSKTKIENSLSQQSRQTENENFAEDDDWSQDCLEYFFDNKIWLPDFVRSECPIFNAFFLILA